jgi:hypothetical protein
MIEMIFSITIVYLLVGICILKARGQAGKDWLIAIFWPFMIFFYLIVTPKKWDESEDLIEHEAALRLFKEFLKENADFIAEGGEPSFAVFLMIRIKKMKVNDPNWKETPTVKG